MRCFVLLSILGLAAGEPTLAEKGQCLVDSGEAVSDAMDAALFIWAASKRCGKVGLELKCSIDVSSGIKSVNSMINVIMSSLKKCDAIKNADCGMQASKLTEFLGGLTAAAGGVAQKCPNPPPNNPVGMGPLASPVLCTVNLKNSAKHLFKAVKSFTKAKSACKIGAKDCAINYLDMVASLSGMGEYLAGAVGQCQRATAGPGVNTDTRTALCAQAAQGLVHETAKVARAGIRLSKVCHPAAPAPAPVSDQDLVIVEQEVPRLYEEDGVKVAGVPITNFVLGAFLPVTAIVGFVGGRFYANRRSQTEQTREIMSDHE